MWKVLELEAPALSTPIWGTFLGLADEGLGGDPELEAAARAERAKQVQQSQDSEAEADDEDEDEWTPKDAAAMAKKEKQMAKRGIVFQSKAGASGKVGTFSKLNGNWMLKSS